MPDEIRLRSPFNGETLTWPPETTPEFVEELLKRGFTRDDTKSAQPPAKQVKK